MQLQTQINENAPTNANININQNATINANINENATTNVNLNVNKKEKNIGQIILFFSKRRT